MSSGKWLSYRERVAEYHKLVRMVARAFYSSNVEDVVVLDGLLHLIETKDTPGVHTVTDADLRALLHLPEKRISAVLTRLKQDHVVRMQHADAEEKEAEPLLEHISKRGRVYARAKPGHVWYVDYVQLLKVLKLRRFRVFESLNRKVDKAEVLYHCPTPACPNHSAQFALMDLLTMPAMRGERGGFVCDQCEANDRGRMVPTPLVVSGGADDGAESGQEQLKARFNEQIRPLTQQMNTVDALLEEQMMNQEELLQDAHAQQAQAQALDAGAQDITVDISSAPSSLTAAPVKPEAPSAGARVLHVPTARTDLAKGMVAALPWAEGGVRSLEEERKRDEESRRKEREDHEERRRVAEHERYQAAYAQELQRMKEAAAAAPPSDALPGDPDLPADVIDEGGNLEGADAMISVAGREVPLSAITQADLDEMTEEELNIYGLFAGQSAF